MKEAEIQKLMYMITKMRQINNQNSSYEDASKDVGARFAQEYVDPLVAKLDADKKTKNDQTNLNKIKGKSNKKKKNRN